MNLPKEFDHLLILVPWPLPNSSISLSLEGLVAMNSCKLQKHLLCRSKQHLTFCEEAGKGLTSSPDNSCLSAGKFASAAAASQAKWGDKLAALLEAEFPTSQGSRSKAQRLKDVWTAIFPNADGEVIFGVLN